MINVNLNENDFIEKMTTADITLRKLFITKQISETEFKKRQKIVSKAKVYYKLNLINFTN